MKNALRKIWPPAWVFAAIFSVYVLFDVAIVLVLIASGNFPRFPTISYEFFRMNPVGAGLAATAAGGYGLYRVFAFHPLFRPGYYQWLRLTPWTSSKRLPMGPVHLVWQDLFLIGILSLSMLRYTSDWFFRSPEFSGNLKTHFTVVDPFIAFLGCYVVALLVALIATETHRFAYALGFGLGFVPFFRGEAIPTILCFAAISVIGMFGIRNSLSRFRDWKLSSFQKLGLFLSHTQNRSRQRTSPRSQQSSWPFSFIGPEQKSPISISHYDAVLLSLMFGWWMYVLCKVNGAAVEDL